MYSSEGFRYRQIELLEYVVEVEKQGVRQGVGSMKSCRSRMTEVKKTTST